MAATEREQMWQHPPATSSESKPPAASLPVTAPVTRVGDVAAMLRVMRPLNGTLTDPVMRRRRLLADLCRLVGMSVGSVAAEPLDEFRNSESASGEPSSPANGDLSPRLEQTLRHLLNGASEKEVANRLKLSKHTVHVYVKALYRRYGVSTRAELLARHLSHPRR